MRLVFLLLFAGVAVTGIKGQSIIKSLERTVPGEGLVTIHQSPDIEQLIGQERMDTKEQQVIKASGFRIQAYSGNNTRLAKNEAYNIGSRIKERFPELVVYTMFNPPRWLCRVGDFRSIEEADAMLRKMRDTGAFKEVTIVKDQINIVY